MYVCMYVCMFVTRKQMREHAYLAQVNVAGAQVAVSDSIRILGVTIDKNLTFDDHVKSVCKNSCYQIWALRHIHPMLTEYIAKSVACSLVNARLDYANSVLFGVISKNILKLQMMQNTLTRVVTGLQCRDHMMSTTKRLHWLPIKSRTDFKIASLTFKVRSANQAVYLASLISS